jgi:hypothetical protein
MDLIGLDSAHHCGAELKGDVVDILQVRISHDIPRYRGADLKDYLHIFFTLPFTVPFPATRGAELKGG